MTQTEALARVRQILNEVTAGYWTDNILYDYLDSGQNHCIQLLLIKQRVKQIIDPNYQHPNLTPLIGNTDITITGATSYSISTITTLIEILFAQLVNTSPARQRNITQIKSLKKLYDSADNTYSSASYSSSTYKGDVFYCIAGSTLYLSTPIPSADFGKLKLWYIAQPTTISSSQDFTLRPDTHEAIVMLAVFYALSQDEKSSPVLADSFFKKAIELIQNL